MPSDELSMQWDASATKAALESFDLSPTNRQVAMQWLSLWTNGEPPRCADFNPEPIKETAPGIAIFDVVPRERVVCRFAGSAYKFLLGCEIAGKDWLASMAPERRADHLKRVTEIVFGTVACAIRRDPDRECSDANFQELQLPFSDIGRDGTRSYLRHIDWRPHASELKLQRPRSGAPYEAEHRAFVCIVRKTTAPNPRSTSVTARPRAPMFEGQKVVVVDDDDAIREVLGLHLEAAGLCVTTLGSARALLAGDYDRSAHCIISDIRMPDIDGLELQDALNRRKSHVPFIVVTAHGDIPLAVRAMRAGAVDVLEKPFRPAALLASVERALALRADLETQDSEKSRSRQRLEALSAREREVFERLAEGKPSKAIAEELGISLRTVDGHRANVMHKLNVKNVGELVRMALSAQ
jgi:two-component system response regulator FixJ